VTHETQGTPIPETVRLRELARKQFDHDLPQLLRDHFGDWVLYHGDRQVALARHTGELYETCRQQRLPLEEVMLFEIIAPDQEILLGPMSFD
jgi:hypothetical protein